MDQPSWLEQAWRELGQRERAGAASNARIVAMYRDAGHADVRHDEVPWCAAFVGACLARAGVAATRSLIARSYATWGTGLAAPRFGAIAVLSRGSDPALGHVGFLVGTAGDTLLLLGGNQGDSVSVAAFDRSRLVALRWPREVVSEDLPSPSRDVTPAPGRFDAALAHVLEMEGGYSDDPHDPGGPTNKGITLREYAGWLEITLDARNTDAIKQRLRDIPDAAVREIYFKNYWLPAGCPDLPPAVALMHFDAAVNHGVGTAIRMLQEAVGAEADGEIGPLTRAALAQSPVRKSVDNYAALRRRRYRALPHFWRFGRGWLNRVEATQKRALDETGAEPLSSRDQGDQGMAKEQQKAPTAKWWGQSITIWGAIVTAVSTVVPALAPVLGIDLPAELVQEAGGQVVGTVQALSGLVGTLLTIFGRIRATQPLQRRDLSLKL